MSKQPPKLALSFLRWFCKPEFLEEIEGNLTELYEIQHRRSPWKANLRFGWNVLKTLRPELTRSLFPKYPINPITMFRHNFVITVRNFRRHKSSFFINLIGLSTGLASALLIYLWVNDELQMDKFHANDSRIYRLLEHVDEATGMKTGTHSSGSMAQALEEEMPEVEFAAAVLGPYDGITLSTGEKNVKSNGRIVNNDFFKMFSYSLIEGTVDNIWAEKNSIVISEALAQNIFGTSIDVLGRTLKLQHNEEYTISGIFENTPSNSSEQFSFAIAFEEFATQEGREHLLSWGSTPATIYVMLRDGVKVEDFNVKISDFVQIKREKEVRFRTPFLVSYSDYYLFGNYENGKQAGGRIEYVRLFSIIAIFIVIIACINFMNISTAKASRRQKEVGIKKATGASRFSLVFQYLGESTLITAIALVIAVGLVWTLLPQFNIITGKELNLNLQSVEILTMAALVLVTGFVSGSYPALYLSGFKPAAVLKGKVSSAGGETWIRKGLVILQFTISVVLIVSVLVVYKQIEYTQTKSLGFNREHVMLVERERPDNDMEHLDAYIEELKAIPGVINASTTGHNLSGGVWGVYGFEWEGKDPNDNTHFEHMAVYYEVLEIFEMDLVAGRTYSQEFSNEQDKAIFNEAAIAHMGLENPVGTTIKFWGREKEIIGVVKDFHFESLHNEVRPMLISLRPGNTEQWIIKVKPGMERDVIAGLEDFQQKNNPGFALVYSFLDEEYQKQYVAEQRVSVLSRYFATLAILISCLGLFGLAAFNVELRTKEVGIRKILGSSNMAILRLLSADLTKLVLVAIIIALPISYYLSSNWLTRFAFAIELEWWLFAGSGLVAMLIAFITVSMQTIKAAGANPVESLKEE